MTRVVSLISACFLSVFCLVSPCAAEIKLPSILADHMVLQQNEDLPIWGWAPAGAEVTVTLSGKKAETKASEDGAWRVDLPPLPAGGPHTLTIVAGKETRILENILIGEVWVCSGQSNMEWRIQNSNNAEAEIAAGNHPNIRLYMASHAVASGPQSDVEGSWSVCSPSTLGNFSAVGYFFGRGLHLQLGVPIGLVKSAWGGTPAESWASPEKVAAVSDFNPIVKRWNDNFASIPQQLEEYRNQLNAWEAQANEAEKDGNPVPNIPGPPKDSRQHPHRVSGLYNAMINPLIPFAIQGAIWYQGESNASRAYQYRAIFPAMIESWREAWGQDDFPFYFVQLANFKATQPEPGESDWAELREAQTMTLSLPNTGQAVIIDIGEAKDIHPRNKQDVGWRLALAALKGTYGKNILFSGPTFKSMKIAGSKARLTFEHAGTGLKTADGADLTGFAVAGEDKKFVWADAKIEGRDTIVVSAKGVKNPVSVRYAWADNPVCNLTNNADLPACPFRTDEWPGVTVDAR